jgi:hypothetical protein
MSQKYKGEKVPKVFRYFKVIRVVKAFLIKRLQFPSPLTAYPSQETASLLPSSSISLSPLLSLSISLSPTPTPDGTNRQSCGGCRWTGRSEFSLLHLSKTAREKIVDLNRKEQHI